MSWQNCKFCQPIQKYALLIKYCTLFIFEISDIDQIKISKDLCVAFLYILDLHKYGRQ